MRGNLRKGHPPLILASASPRRIELMKEWGLRFDIRPSNVDESTALIKPSSIVKALALRKASSVAADVRDGLVIGSDTIVVFQGKIIGKPADEKDAARILSMLNGSTHKVYSGVAVIDAATGRTEVVYDVTTVHLRKLSQAEIRRFSGKHLDKAGAYAVQEKGDAFVERIEGDYFNVVGLPFHKLKEVLSRFSVSMPAHPGSV